MYFEQALRQPIEGLNCSIVLRGFFPYEFAEAAIGELSD